VATGFSLSFESSKSLRKIADAQELGSRRALPDNGPPHPLDCLVVVFTAIKVYIAKLAAGEPRTKRGN
jgi:hypothetical protein